jgi:2-polyprenyl-3-methyl-5-hydroxy-6-metoxy-1,4-benzoquinol methylase
VSFGPSTPPPPLDDANGPRHCPNCDHESATAFSGIRWRLGADGRDFGYAQCPHCGLVYADPFPSAAEVDKFYAENFDYGKYSERRSLKRIQGADRWRRLRPRLSSGDHATGNLLDVGCGHGWFLAAARRDGWDCTGIDFPSEATAFARNELRLKIVEADILSADLAEASFDLVTLWHSLEHMRAPEIVLPRLRALLKPGGLLLIAVPNSESRGLARIGAWWVWLQQPFIHLWHFSPRTLTDYLLRAGFREITCTTRDTWDANYLYDALIFPRIDQPLVQRPARLLARLVGRLGGDGERTRRKIRFYLDEGFRLIAYALQSGAGILRGPDCSGRGSELCATAVAPRTSATILSTAIRP